jgi:hypothetical protein
MKIINVSDHIYEKEDLLSGFNALQDLLSHCVLHEFYSTPLSILYSALEEALEQD